MATLCTGISSQPCLQQVLTCGQENWVPAANTGASNKGEYELHQRCQLIEKWASATQELRDVNSTPGRFLKFLV